MNYEEKDNIVVENLKEDINRALKNGDDEFISHLLKTLEYYLPKSEYDVFVTPLQPQINNLLGIRECNGDIYIEEVVENTDGSADITFRMNQESKEFLTGEGVNHVLIKGILNCNNDELFRWAKIGKEHEKGII